MILRKPAAEHPDEYWDKVLSINLDAAFILAREFGKEMIGRPKREDHLHMQPPELSGRG